MDTANEFDKISKKKLNQERWKNYKVHTHSVGRAVLILITSAAVVYPGNDHCGHRTCSCNNSNWYV